MKRIFLTLSLVVAIAPATLAQDKPAAPQDKPAAPAQDALPAREKSVVGVYKSEMPGAPVITITAMGKQLIMSATGYPDIPVTLDDKWGLSNPALPGEYSFTIVRDKDGKITGLDVKTPMGGGVFARQPDKKAVAPAIPDVLGKYEPDEPGPVGTIEVKLVDGKLVSEVENQPTRSIKIGPKDQIEVDGLPEGVTVKLARDKDGKAIAILVDTDSGVMRFTRKTFPKPPGAEDPAIARLKGVTGTYDSAVGGVPVVTITLKDGHLIIQAEGNPEVEVKLDDKDKLTGDGLPEGFELTLTRDKDGKVIGMHVVTPMGEVDFTRTPLPEPKQPAADKKPETEKKPA